MSQHDYNLANASGATFRADLNSALGAIATQNSGTSAPSTTFAFEWWADTTLGLLKIRNAANSAWVSVGTLASYALGLLPNKLISGLTYGNNATDATNDIDIFAGQALDATNAYLMTLSSTLVKRLDAAWTVGTNQGGLDTGSIGNSDYYIWLIARSDTGVVDALFSLSSTAPTMPTNYDFKRLIGWFKRVGATIVAFHTYELEGGGLDFAWDAPSMDVNLANTLTTSRRTDAVKVPLNFSVIALLRAEADDAGEAFARIECPDVTDSAVGAGSANLPVHTVALGRGYRLHIRTSATGTIAARASVATIDNYQVVTDGFYWARKN